MIWIVSFLQRDSIVSVGVDVKDFLEAEARFETVWSFPVSEGRDPFKRVHIIDLWNLLWFDVDAAIVIIL